MDKIRKCFLRCLQNLHSPIQLNDGQELEIGRSAITNITDLQLSRKQVSVKADYKNATVAFKQIGPNISGLNGNRAEKNRLYQLKDSDRIELLLGKYVYEINFEPKQGYRDTGKTEKKSKQFSDLQMTNSELYKNTNKDTSKEKRQHSPDETVCADVKKQKLSSMHGIDESCSIATNSESEECIRDNWEDIDSGKLLIFTKAGVKPSTKIAAYDLDGTLIKTKSGLVFAKDSNDWQIAFPQIPGKLKQLQSSGYKLVVFTNQAGIGKGKIKPSDFKQKVENIIKKLGVPMQVFISTTKGIFRKPMTGMWNTLVEQKNCGIFVSRSDSFYCGDAAGRPDKWALGKKKDFSCADRLMAENLNIPFHTPEEHFQNSKPVPWNRPEFNPISLRDLKIERFEPPGTNLIGSGQEVIILVGSPGSGKSFIAQELADAGYIHINRDKLGTWQKCVAVLKQALRDGKSAVIDNTNPDKDSRKRYIESVGSVKIRCGIMMTSLTHCRHNNLFRELIDKKHVPVTDMVLYSYRKKFEEPVVAEGFSEVFKINFVPQFKNKEHERLYHMYLIEK